jgi:protein TonB
MFEQSILLEGPAGKKTGVFFASLSAQISAVGVLLLIPLVYTERLPMAHITLPVPMTFSQPPQPPPQTVSSQPVSARPSMLRPVFVLPTSVLPLNSAPAPAGFDADAPLAPLTSYGTSAPLGSFIPSMVRIQPPQSIPTTAPLRPLPPSDPIRVSEGVQAAKIIRKVIPVYPALARQARISGTVRLLGVIAKDGTVHKLQVLSGHPLLQGAALDAVRQWLYQPTILSGKPVEVEAPIDVIFTLN